MKAIKAKTRLRSRDDKAEPKTLGVIADRGKKLENFRLGPADRENIADIVKALESVSPNPADKTKAVKVALQLAAELARNGKGDRLAKPLREIW